MSIEVLEKMSTIEKVDLIFKSVDKKTLRKICNVSPSKFKMLEVSGEKQFKKFLAGKIEQLSDESFYHYIQN